jgi:hypothetical protein
VGPVVLRVSESVLLAGENLGKGRVGGVSCLPVIVPRRYGG